MKTINRKINGLFAGIIVALAFLLMPNINANANPILGEKIFSYMPTEDEISELLDHYSFEDYRMVQLIKVQVFNNNLEVVYSDVMNMNDYECDKELNLLLNQSDFVTEIDNNKIYMLK